jgi:hypothetical protein
MMLLRTTGRLLQRFSQLASKNVAQTAPAVAAPKLHPGELESFRFERENDRIYEGYTEEELYGVKIGLKHSKAMQAEMLKYLILERRDNVAATLIFLVGAGLVYYNHLLFAEDVKNHEQYIQANLKVNDDIFTVAKFAQPK